MDLLEELKRRKVVRTLAGYGAALFLVLQVADLTFEPLGLPEHAYRWLLVVGLLGFPLAGALSWFYDVRPDGRNPDAPPMGRGALAGIFGGAVLVLGVTVWFLLPSRSASLVAQGILSEGDALVLASFGGADEEMAALVTEALRVTLSTSPTFSLLQPSTVRSALQLMEMSPSGHVDPEVARQIALREGAKAYVSGTVGRLGDDYLFLAEVIEAESGTALASFRETAAGDADLIDGIDRLAARIRSEVGESLASVAAREPLHRVTTASLPALRAYTVGRLAYDRGEPREAVQAYRDAIAIDSDFAMAWSMLGPVLQSTASEAEWIEAVESGYELRERLTPMERYIVEQRYHDTVSGDVDAEIYAAERLLELDPNRAGTLSALGRARGQHYGDFDAAAEAMTDAISINDEFASSSNIVWVRLFQGRVEDTRAAVARFNELYPGTFWRHRGVFFVEYHAGDPGVALTAADSMQAAPDTPDRWRSRARFWKGLSRMLDGDAEGAVAGVELEMERAAAAGQPELALARAMDLVWLTGVVMNDGATARAYAERALSSGWFEASPDDFRPAFRTVRDPARAGLVDVAERFLARWEALPASRMDWSRQEDLEAARALVRGYGAEPIEGARALSDMQSRRSPRFTQREWPSARHCQRCWLFDIARLWDRAEVADSAATYYRRVIDETDDMIETPLNRVLAHERLAALGR